MNATNRATLIEIAINTGIATVSYDFYTFDNKHHYGLIVGATANRGTSERAVLEAFGLDRSNVKFFWPSIPSTH